MTLSISCKRIGSHSLLAPKRAHPGDAGLDLCAVIREGQRATNGYVLSVGRSFVLHGNSRAVVPCGFAFEIPAGYVGLVQPRSGLSKRGIVVRVGVIDSAYRGEVGIQIENHDETEEDFQINHGDRIAQLVIVPCPVVELAEVAELGASERGVRGFGSSGVRTEGQNDPRGDGRR